jgi:hypothetical protein
MYCEFGIASFSNPILPFWELLTILTKEIWNYKVACVCVRARARVCSVIDEGGREECGRKILHSTQQ